MVICYSSGARLGWSSVIVLVADLVVNWLVSGQF